MSSWRCAVVEGIGPVVMDVLSDDGHEMIVRYVTAAQFQPEQTDEGVKVRAMPQPIPIEAYGFTEGPIRVLSRCVVLSAKASPDAVAMVEACWNLNPLAVVPGGNGG